jgi:IS5 family transposase
MIRMLIVGYCYGIRSERRLCEEVHLNLAYRWFCRLGLEGKVPDHSTFSENRHGRFRESDTFRYLFEWVLQRCMSEGLVGDEGFAVDASLVKADASRQHHRDDNVAGWGTGPGSVSSGNASRDIPHAGISLLVTTLTAAVAHAHEVQSAPASVQQHVQAWLGTTDKNGTPARLLVVAGAEDLPE